MKDYSLIPGMDIQYAFSDLADEYPDVAGRPDYVQWGATRVRASLRIESPRRGRFRLEFLGAAPFPEMGLDVSAGEGGSIRLSRGSEVVHILRTWHSEVYEPVVEHQFETPTGQLDVWPVSRVRWKGGRTTDEVWTGNSGLRLDESSARSFLLSCSHASAPTPDFSRLKARLELL